MTPRERLAAIEARCEAATDGPWHAANRGVGWEVHYGPVPQDCWDPDEENCRDLHSNSVIHEIKGTMEERDATFIAAARDDLPALAAFARAVLDVPYFARLDRITVNALADEYLGGES